MKYYIIVGEASGDVHGAKLMRGILKEDPQAEFRFWGGDRMVEVGGAESLVSHYRESAVMGFVAVALNLRTLLRRFKKCESDILSYQPDVVLLIDYAGFNLRIAKFAKKRGFKTFFYIAPKVWAWKESRVKKIKKYVDELFIIFPFEIDYFARKGIKAHYEGNPIMDEIEFSKQKITSREQFLEDNGLAERPIIALLAGSRVKEIELNLPFMSQVAEQFPAYQFVVAGVSWIDKSVYQRVISEKARNLVILTDKTYNILLHSEAAIVTSGTATLETALLGIPEVVCYSCSRFSYFMFKNVMTVKYISLVNIILGREAVRELLSVKLMTVENAVNEMSKILPGGVKYNDLMRDYEELNIKIGNSGASDRFGKLMVKLLRG